tara:strand:+ start:295 stop:1557 length:1263 start_codon:yes stop_codon:yes gene_type:complete
MFKILNNNFSKIIISIFFFSLIILVINNEQISRIIWWFPELFGDLKTPVKWLECNNLGLNFYEDKNSFMKCAKREFNYGKIFFEIPYSDRLNFFYIKVLPYILIFLSIYLFVIIFAIQNYISLIILILVIFNPSSFLLYSGANIDLLIFVLLVFTVLNRVYIINWALYFFLTFTKIYPIILFLNIFFENKNRSIKKIFTIFLIIFIISISYLYFNYSEYIYFLNNLSGAKAGYHYLFSLNSSAKILKYLFNFNYILLLILTYFLFFYLTSKAYKKISLNLNNDILNNINFYSYEFKLFIISSYLSILCFIFFSNFFHREIFLIGILPLIIKLAITLKKFPFQIILNIYLAKLFYSYIYSYFNVNDGIQYIEGQRIFSNLFILAISFKSLIDYLLMIMLTALSLYFANLFYKNLKKNFNYK